MLHDLTLPTALPETTGTTPTTGTVTLRDATEDDLDAIVALLADDPVSAARGDVAGDEDRPAYLAALRSVVDDPANALLVAADARGAVLGTMQLTRIPGMARRGASRLLVEAVRVRSDQRSAGIGGAMMRWVTDVAAPALGTPLVQLTSDSARTDAHRFYRRLGFVDSHVGFKYRVDLTD